MTQIKIKYNWRHKQPTELTAIHWKF